MPDARITKIMLTMTNFSLLFVSILASTNFTIENLLFHLSNSKNY